MSIISSAEERKLRELKAERKQIFIKFAQDLKSSFIIWIKLGGIISGVLILAYLFAKFVMKWDLFYETDLKYSKIFFAVFIFFLLSVIVCWLVAFLLYNTKHKRNTRYKDTGIGRGGNNHD
ncbi:MAG: hypothetical protein HDT42_03055 [Ruminococcaceae bacterium]|nr:hypothetical protein [Oscillospiraceae bacterium]